MTNYNNPNEFDRLFWDLNHNVQRAPLFVFPVNVISEKLLSHKDWEMLFQFFYGKGIRKMLSCIY